MTQSNLSLYELIFAGDCRTISIAGESASGKTTLALQILRAFLSLYPNSGCVWFNCTELFPTKRFQQLCRGIDVHTLLERVLIIPNKKVIRSLDQLKECLTQFMHNMEIFPFDTTLLVIDNISSQIRYELGNAESINEKHRIMNTFFLENLSPLLFATERCNLWLIICHEVSYSPKDSHNRTFYNSLYRRIKSIKINLEKNPFYSKNIAKISINDNSFSIPYKIVNTGLVITK